MGNPSNTYYICLSYGDRPIPWDVNDRTERNAPAYFGGVLRAMEKRLEQQGLTVYLTWKLDELPSYGNDVVAVVLGDEWGRVPAYAPHVLATFKCYGIGPSLGGHPLRHPSVLNGMLAAKFVRTYAYYLPGALRYTRQRLAHAVRRVPLPPIFDVPLGYGNQLDLPIKDIAARRYDLFFAGSVQHTRHAFWSPKRWIQTPKTLARCRMLRNLEAFQQRRPEWQIDLATMSTFAWNALHYGAAEARDMLDAQAYSERMMDARICLVPRGTSPETFRYFEALRYGCVLITERLPSRWFYAGSPAIELDDWNELEAIATTVLTDADLLRRKHREALHWWATRCSEEAVGAFMAEQVNSLRAGATRDVGLMPA